MNNEALISQFYTAFSNGDAEKMVECYADDVVFEDPAFGRLKGERAKNMWRMLLNRGSNIDISSSHVNATEKEGSASWVAKYSYGPKKRQVVNTVQASFELSNGKIVKHTDHFNLWKWSQQALGMPGYLLGWSSFMKAKIQNTVNGLLDKFEAAERSK